MSKKNQKLTGKIGIIFGCEVNTCSLKWGDLTPTDDNDIRYCSSCDSRVYLVHSDEQAADFASKRYCIAQDDYPKERLMGEPILPDLDIEEE